MSYNPYTSVIANLNQESPVASSPEDFVDDLSLWTNAEFTFDMPPGMGIFEQDSGYNTLALQNSAHSLMVDTLAAPLPSEDAAIAAAADAAVQALNPQAAMDQQHLFEYLNLPSDESRPMSLLERTRQRNPVNQDQPKPELQAQAVAINAFHSLLAQYTASNLVQQQQQQQQSQTQTQQTIQPLRPQSVLPTLLPNLAPATAPTTPAAAKLLRQPPPQFKPTTAKKQKIAAAISPAPPKSPATINAAAMAALATNLDNSSVPVKVEKVSAIPPTPVSAPNNDMDKDDDDQHILSAADSFSKDDPEYLQKVAAEEDKRRRNTAASARFRFKKKLREQALEQTAREQTVRAESLETRVKELEMEVKWLRGLIVEKDTRLHEAALSASLEEQSNKRIKLDTY